ncbi:MAG: OsmC family protein [Anaerolineae bacterium]
MATGSIELDWVRDEVFVGSDATGRSVVLGKVPGAEPEFRGVKASALLLISLAGCSAHDVVAIFQKQNQQVTNFQVVVEGTQEDTAPWRFTHIHIRYKLTGRNLNESFIKRAIELSQGKYCSVYATLKDAVTITSEYEIKSE